MQILQLNFVFLI